MRLFFLLTLFLLFSAWAVATVPSQPYFQQEVNTTIHARLLDEQNLLDASITLEYINHSPDTLHEIYMHLWANAYKNNKTAFAQQLIRQNNYDFHFASYPILLVCC